LYPDLVAARLRVRQSKTDACIRCVDLLPVLDSELTALREAQGSPTAGPVFPSAAGTRQDRNRMRNRMLGKAVERANKSLADAKLVALPEGLTLHALRRTFASVLVALGRDPAYVMGRWGAGTPR
jgi:integrase